MSPSVILPRHSRTHTLSLLTTSPHHDSLKSGLHLT